MSWHHPITERLDALIHWVKEQVVYSHQQLKAEREMADNLQALTDAVNALAAEVAAAVAAIPKPDPSQQAAIDDLTGKVSQATADLKAAVPTP